MAVSFIDGETRVPRENHRPAAGHWQNLSHNVVPSTPHPSGIQIHNFSGFWYDCTDSCKFHFHTIMTTMTRNNTLCWPVLKNINLKCQQTWTTKLLCHWWRCHRWYWVDQCARQTCCRTNNILYFSYNIFFML